MYLVMFEGDAPKTCEHITNSEFEACNDGYLELVDISNPKAPTMWYQDSWIPLDKYGEH